eukprot:8863277-Pyramimonas_sp.AAC.1
MLGERHVSALAANSGTVIDGILFPLMDVGSNINIESSGIAQTVERGLRSHGCDIKDLDLEKILYVTGVGNGAAVWNASLHCKAACKFLTLRVSPPAHP